MNPRLPAPSATGQHSCCSATCGATALGTTVSQRTQCTRGTPVLLFTSLACMLDCQWEHGNLLRTCVLSSKARI
eukprot:90853-Rhodomonas_salina.2